MKKSFIVDIYIKMSCDGYEYIDQHIFIFKAKNDEILERNVRNFIEKEYESENNENLKVIAFEYNTIKCCSKTENKNIKLFSGNQVQINYLFDNINELDYQKQNIKKKFWYFK